MAERSRTGYITAFPFDVKKPKSDIVGADAVEHDHRLWELRAAYDLVVGNREQFLRDKTEIDQRLAEGELGPVGHQRALKALRDKCHAALDEPRKTVARVRKYAERIVLKPAPDQADDNKPMSRAEFRAELARRSAVERFTNLDPSAQRNAIRVASEKKDFGYLQMILDEPALIVASTAKAIEMDIARNSNPYAFECWQDMNGRVVDGKIEPDPLTGALPVVSFVIDSTEKWFDEQTGDAPDMKERLAQQAAEKAGTNGGTGDGA